MTDVREPGVSRADEDGARLRALEAQAAADRQTIASLESALASSRRIGAAIGIIMATEKVTEAAAFAQLRDASHWSNRKLRDIADDVVTTGALP